MKSFLLKPNNKPLINWGNLVPNTHFTGTLPENYSLAVSPGEGYVVLDVDRHGNISGFDNIPHLIQMEIDNTFNYSTKNNGKHYWLKYLGNKELLNKTSGLGIDLRVANKGYVRFYPAEKGVDIRECIHLIKPTSLKLNIWLEKLFSI